MNGYENIAMISQPVDLKISLYPHQLASVYKLEQLECNPCIETNEYKLNTQLGIFADMTGYGKTLSIVSLILRDTKLWDGTKPYTWHNQKTYMNQHITYTEKETFPTMPQTIILVNPSIVHQWVKEFNYTSLQVRVITKQNHLSEIQETEDDVLIVVPSMFNYLMTKYTGIVWKRFVYDEPSHMRVPSMKKIRAGFIWLVTATPLVEVYLHHSNCSGFMYDLFYDFYKMKNSLPETMIVKNEPEFIQASYQMPPTYYYTHKCYSSLLSSIQNFVSPKIKKLLEANNIGEAIHLLGGKKTDSIFNLLMKQKREEREEMQTKLRIWQGRNQPSKILFWKQKLDRVNQDMDNLEKLYTERLNEPCSICFEKLNEPILEPNCQNLFCGKCLLTWLQGKKTCPLCRAEVEGETLLYQEMKGSEDLEKKVDMNTKEHAMLSLFHEKPTGKFIVFSEWDNSFKSLIYEMNQLGIKYSTIQGTVEGRTELINKFRTGDTQVLLLNATESSAGLNLVETTDIILYHNMSEATQRQIIGRANRLGRKESLQVHYLVYI